MTRSQHVHLVEGGEQRSDSVLHALRFVQQSLPGVTHVAIHDAARPLVSAMTCRPC